MESETRRKIEETVAEILSNANLEETTEYKLRLAASERLGIDLSGPEARNLVRIAVENFLLSTPESNNAQEAKTDTTSKNERYVCKVI